jgi:hypothetical protein
MGLGINTPNGYRKLCVNGSLTKVARIVLERKLGRPLRPGEVSHHVNGIKTDDRPDNLVAMTASEHSRMHGIGKEHGFRPGNQYWRLRRHWPGKKRP